jgi:hypothetical protein
MLHFQCSQSVSRAADRITSLRVNPVGDGTRASPRTIEILAECVVSVSVEVTERKLPLKIFLQYEKKSQLPGVEVLAPQPRERAKGTRPGTAIPRRPEHNADLVGDLTVYSSSDVREPNSDNCSQLFVNPVSRLVLRNQIDQASREPGASRKPMLESDIFITSHIYLTLYSSKGCTVTLTCQFPSEEEKTGVKKAVSIACNQREFRKEKQREVREKVEELEGHTEAQR